MDQPEALHPIASLRAAANVPLAEWLALHPEPALQLLALPAGRSPRPTTRRTPAERSFTKTVAGTGGDAAVVNGRVAFLKKRAGNPFPNMVSLGRAMNNDVVILLETVSKVHGYFLVEGGRWFYSDHHSTNGTLVNGTALLPDERRALADGDRLQLGTELAAIFLMPSSLYERVRP